jgi:GWxTD domain-containing protein
MEVVAMKFHTALVATFCAGLLCCFCSKAQTGPTPEGTVAGSKQQKDRHQKLAKELGNAYKDWLEQDVPYIISKEELELFQQLSTNEEREQFIEAFWARRNPSPESLENTFKEEHYRRIAYANEHYASGIPGWKTDRGRLYIMWGPPDEIESHPTGGTYDRPMQEGGGSTSTYSWEKWRYRHLEDVGENVEMEFVDESGSGEYHLTMDPGEKDALAHVPGAGRSALEAMGQVSKAQRFTNTDGTTTPRGLGTQSASANEFDRLERLAAIQRPPKFKDLDVLVSTRMIQNQIHLDCSLSYLREAGDSVLVPITLQIPNRELEFRANKQVHSATVDVYGRISTPTGQTVQTFDEVVGRAFPESLFSAAVNQVSLYQKAIPLRPGLYRLDIVVKDEASGNVGIYNAAMRVPRYEQDKLDASSLLLADQIEVVPIGQLGLGPFVIGSRKVRPRINKEFSSSERMGIYLEVYNLQNDATKPQSKPQVSYRILRGQQEIWKADELGEKVRQTDEQIAIHDFVSLAALEPGAYVVEIRVTDPATGETITRKSDFTIKAAAKSNGLAASGKN